MKNMICIVLLLVVTLLSINYSAEAACGDRTEFLGEGYDGTHACEDTAQDSFTKRVSWRINWTDGESEERNVLDSGANRWWHSISCFPGSCCEACWPSFENPFFEESSTGTSATWVQVTKAGKIVNGACATESVGWRSSILS